MWGLELGIVLVMIMINSIFAAYEIALASVSFGRLTALSREHRTGAAAAARMKDKMEASLAVVQLGITLVGVIAAATGGAGAEESIEPWLKSVGLSNAASQFVALTLVVIPLTVVTIVFGELLPKVFALRNKELVCLRLSSPMEWFARSVWPAVWLLEKSVMLIMRWGEHRWKSASPAQEHAEEAALQELRAVAALARTSRLIDLREEGIIVNAARLSSTPVRNIMLPAQHIAMLNLNDSLDQNLIAAHRDMHTRFPVTVRPGDPQGIIGYANFKDIVASMRMSPHEPSLSGILRPLPSLPEDRTVAQSLEQLIHERNHIALIVDRQNLILGMMTLEDVLEELVGDIHDEYDRLPSHITKSGSGWVVGGHATVAGLRTQTGIDLTTAGTASVPLTVDDWVVQKLGRQVEGGEIIIDGDLRAVIRKVRRHHVLEAQITRRV